MIKTAKMQGNVMVSAGEARGGREDLQGGSGTGGESRTPGKDRDPRAERGGAATISHLNPPYPQRRPPGCEGSGVRLQITTLQLWVPVLWAGGSVSWATGGVREVGKGRRTGPRRLRVRPSARQTPGRHAESEVAEARGGPRGRDARTGLGAASSRARDLVGSAKPVAHSGRTPVALFRRLPPRPPAGRAGPCSRV